MDSLPHDVQPMRPRPTVYRGVLMRSTLESQVAQMLDSIPGITWEYEPARYADPTGSWLPDFVVRGLPCHLFIEVKGPPQTAEQRAETLRQMLRVWGSAPAVGLATWTPATLDGAPFELLRQGLPIVRLALTACPRCGAGRIIRTDGATRSTCRSCSAAAA